MRIYKYINTLIVFWFCFGCSTQKDVAINRLYHQLNTKYNGLFYAQDYLKKGIKKINTTHQENYSELITVFKHIDLKSAQSAQPLFDQAIQKATIAIKQHSMEIEGVEKNKLINQAYLIIGKSKFYKQDYDSAINTFNYLVRKADNKEMAAEAVLWVAKCQEKLRNKQALIQRIYDLEENHILTKQQKSILFAIKAENEITYQNYKNAKQHLLSFINLTNNKTEKVRAQYLLGQISLVLDEKNDAKEFFTKVLKSNPEYELAFNAKLNRAKTFIPNNDSFKKIKLDLEKMLVDKKNKEYRDQIYFAIANLELTNQDTIAAISSLKQSAHLSTNNNGQKIESHYILAKIFWKNQNYIESYHHSDSAYKLLGPETKKYAEIKRMLRNSKKIAQKYIRINYNDSIIGLALLSDKERNTIIDNFISELKLKDEKEKSLSLDSRQTGSTFNSFEYNKQTQNSMNITSGGGWYFYNPSAISLGYSEFMSRWGNRKLEDNWRRKNKNQIDELNDIMDEAQLEGPSEKEKYNRDYYISQLPLTKEKKEILFSEIETDYYDLAKIFKSDLQDYNMAISVFNELTERFPKTDYMQLIYFDLYNIYTLKQDTLQANSFSKKMELEFPDSNFLLNLKGEGPLNEKLLNDQKNYEKIYELYIQNTKAACIQIGQLKEQEVENIYIDKIDFLSILCEAKYQQKGVFISKLEEMRDKYPQSPLSKKSDSMALILKGELEGIIETSFINEFEESHYFMLLLSDISINLPEIQASISRFNQQNYNLDSLETENLLLTKQDQIFRVGEFKDKTNALLYYEAIKENNTSKSIFQNKAVRSFVISKNNFYLLLKEKNIEEYENYFQTIYLLN